MESAAISGTAAQTVLVALAHAFAYNSPADTSTNADELVDSEDEDEEPKTSTEASPESGAEHTMAEGTDVVEDLEAMIASVQFKMPHEAVKLSSGKRLTRDARNELAVIAVKRAFSECPSLTLLVDALLRYPVHEIHMHCMLTPGTRS